MLLFSFSVIMKSILCCLLLVVAAQAIDWTNIHPVYRTFETQTASPSNGRIIGGSVARPGQFPYQVGLFLDGSGFCGGSLISNNVVLTAAHCAQGTRSFEAHFGAQNIYDETEPDRVISTTTDGVVHENYNANNLNNDIAVVRLTETVSGSNIASIDLPTRSQEGDLFEGTRPTVSGWGRVSDSNPNINPELKYVDLLIIANAECENVYGNVIVPSMICLSTNNGNEGTCNGDSGGPLVLQGTQIGVVSFGASAGCEAGYPLGFTRVTSFLTWLEDNAGVTIQP